MTGPFYGIFSWCLAVYTWHTLGTTPEGHATMGINFLRFARKTQSPVTAVIASLAFLHDATCLPARLLPADCWRWPSTRSGVRMSANEQQTRVPRGTRGTGPPGWWVGNEKNKHKEQRSRCQGCCRRRRRQNCTSLAIVLVR
jgi:hypothetical protein